MLSSIKAISMAAKKQIIKAADINQTLRIFRKLEKTRGRLPDETRRKCAEYAIDVLGGKEYAPWLYIYALLSGRFKEGWIPDNYYGKVVVPKLKGAYGDTSELNALQSKLFDCELFPDILYHANGIFLDREMNVVPMKDVKGLLFKDGSKVVFKRDKSMQGRGVSFLSDHDFENFMKSGIENGVFQKALVQHAALEEFHSSSVATIRFTTVVDEAGVPSLRACYARFGTGDDTHVRSASHVRVPVDLETGELSEAGYTADWATVLSHPDTGIGFARKEIPSFRDCRKLVLELHKSVPFVRCIGWDVTVGHKGDIAVLEWNGAHNDIKFSEVTQGPCFSDLGWESLWR